MALCQEFDQLPEKVKQALWKVLDRRVKGTGGDIQKAWEGITQGKVARKVGRRTKSGPQCPASILH